MMQPALMNPDQLERYASWLESLACTTRGPMAEHLRAGAEMARSNGEPSFYSDFTATRRAS